MTIVLLAKNIHSGQSLKLFGDYSVKGDIPANVTIEHRDGELIIEGNAGAATTIRTTGQLSVKAIGEYSSITAASMQIGNIGSHSKLFASKGPIVFHRGGDNIKVVCEGSLNFKTIGCYAEVTASDIKCEKIGDHSLLIARLGGIRLVKGGAAVKVVTEGTLVFSELGIYSDLTASEITGSSIGSHSKIRATQSTVTLNGKIGAYCTIENADGITFAWNQHASKKMSPSASQITVRNIGCGVHVDLKNQSYIVPDSLIVTHGKQYLDLFERLLNLGYNMQKEVLYENGREVFAHRIAGDGTRASFETLRKLVTTYIETNSQLGKYDAP